MFNGKYDEKTQRFYAEFDSFIQELQRYTPISKHHQKRIKTLLDVDNKGGKVDLKVFQTIVGVEKNNRGNPSSALGNKKLSDSEKWKEDR